MVKAFGEFNIIPTEEMCAKCLYPQLELDVIDISSLDSGETHYRLHCTNKESCTYAYARGVNDTARKRIAN